MRSLCLLITLVTGAWLCTADAGHAETRAFTDGAGRQVAVPTKIERVFAAGRPAAITLYTLVPDKLLGWPQGFRAEEKAFLPERYAALPVLGGLFGRAKSGDLETLVAARPDIIIDIGSIDPTHVSAADRVQAQTGIPYVIFDGSFDKTAELYGALGALLEAAPKAAELAAFSRKTFADMRALAERAPADHPVRVYYARGPKGLETALSGSLNTEMLGYVGAVNVATDPNRTGLATVSPEQVLGWDPEVIITLNADFYRAIWTDPIWQGVAAVRSKRVYLAPSLPFGWFDLPASVNRLIGEHWLASVLHPESARDLPAIAAQFYEKFYHITLTEAQLDRLLHPKP